MKTRIMLPVFAVALGVLSCDVSHLTKARVRPVPGVQQRIAEGSTAICSARQDRLDTELERLVDDLDSLTGGDRVVLLEQCGLAYETAMEAEGNAVGVMGLCGYMIKQGLLSEQERIRAALNLMAEGSGWVQRFAREGLLASVDDNEGLSVDFSPFLDVLNSGDTRDVELLMDYMYEVRPEAAEAFLKEHGLEGVRR
jgi:hypothetical protein